MDHKLLYKTAMLAGEITACSGAETYRVEDTMEHILKLSGFKTIHVFATTTGIIATIDNPGIEPITSVTRIRNRANNLNRIDQVNQISRKLCKQMITVEEAYEKLQEVRNCRLYSKKIIAVCLVIATISFVSLFGGGYQEFFVAGIAGVMMVLISHFFATREGSDFMIDATKSFVIALLAMSFHLFMPQLDTETVIIGSIMPLVPGIPITNAIRDTLQGDYMSGLTRAAEAFVTALGIAVGVGFGLGFFNMLGRVV